MRQRATQVLLFSLLAGFAGASYADDLADANQMLAQKNYPEALRRFTQLADAGNAEAQLRLGEMYWYGEGTALDRAKGDALFALAAKQGNAEALAAMGLSGKRTAKADDIAYWTSKYDGSDLSIAKYGCVEPAIPDASVRQAEIVAVGKAVESYAACYEDYVAAARAIVLAKEVPAEVTVLLSESEYKQVQVTMGKALARLVAPAKAEAEAVLAKRLAWKTASEAKFAQASLEMDVNTEQLQLAKDAVRRAAGKRLPPPPKPPVGRKGAGG